MTEIHQRLVAVYGDSAPNYCTYCTVTRWFNKFTEDNFRSGRPSDAVNPISIATAETSSSAMAERPRELDQRFQMGVNLRLL